MAEFKDNTEENHVSSFLTVDSAFWIGLNDLSEEGLHFNQNSIPKIFDFNAQGSLSGLKPIKLLSTPIGQPDDGGIDRHEDCVQLLSEDDESFGWNDASCDDTDNGNRGKGYFALCKTD